MLPNQTLQLHAKHGRGCTDCCSELANLLETCLRKAVITAGAQCTSKLYRDQTATSCTLDKMYTPGFRCCAEAVAALLRDQSDLADSPKDVGNLVPVQALYGLHLSSVLHAAVAVERCRPCGGCAGLCLGYSLPASHTQVGHTPSIRCS